MKEIIRIPITVLLLYGYTKYTVNLPFNKQTLSIKNLNMRLWMLVGFSLPILTLLIFYSMGNLSIENINTELSQSYILDNIFKALGLSLASGMIEEVIFRGYLFNLLKSKYNFLIAAVVPSLFFVLIHLGRVDSIINAVQLLVAGSLFSFMSLTIYLYTKCIWNAGIVHFLWNFLILNGLIVFSNKMNSEALVYLNIGANSLFNGGAFGIETSIPAILIYLISSLLLWKLYKKKAAIDNNQNGFNESFENS